MSRYRKIHVRIYGDEKFRALSRPQPNGQSLWIYLLTGPQTGPIPGLYAAGEMQLAEELDWPVKPFRERFEELTSRGMAKADWKARLIWIPNAIRYDPPDNPNVVKSWARAFDELPECDIKREAYQHIKAFLEQLGKAFADPFGNRYGNSIGNRFPNGMPKQEQEQEQEPKQEQEQKQEEALCAGPAIPRPTPPAAEALTPYSLTLNDGSKRFITQHELQTFKSLYRAVDIEQELRSMEGWLMTNPDRRKTKRGILRFVNTWLEREQDDARADRSLRRRQATMLTASPPNPFVGSITRLAAAAAGQEEKP